MKISNIKIQMFQQRSFCTIAFIILNLSIVTWALYAEGSKIAIESSVDRSKITIGDLIKYTVTVTRDESVKVQLPGLAENLGGFEIRDYHVYEPQKQDGKLIDKVEYTISTFDIGEFEIPPLTIFYTLPGDTTRQALRTEPIKIVVESVKPSEAGDIKDIKPQVEVPRNWRRIILFASAGVLVVLLILGVIYYLKKRRAGEPLFPAKPEILRPPHEVAFEELEQLKNSDLLQKGEIKLYYIRISDIIRRYIEGRYQIPAIEMTTTDLLQNMHQAEIDEGHIQLVQQFLELCDLVKFAKYIPTDEENVAILQQAYTIVDQTKWVEEAEPVAESAEAVMENGGSSPEEAQEI
ncbi:hypothetical protein DRQ15_04425 [candidate division KSB1 bacterium]|nr:MAG: hypothetical protein DRQ15_04425 [candidate division KSB1 bacterium]